MSRAKVWFIGGEDVRFRIPLLLELRTRGFEVAAVGSEGGEAFRGPGIPYYRYRLDRGVGPLADVHAYGQLARLFRDHRPDVIHAFDTKPSIYAPIAARKAGVPGRVRTITGMGHVFSSRSALALALRPVYRTLNAWASRASGVTIFQNEDDRAYFLDHRMVEPGRSALVRSSGIDVPEFLSRRPDAEALARLRSELGLQGRTVVTMIARLVQQKGVREYLQAAKIARAEIQNVTFLLVGPASSEGRKAVSVKEVEGVPDVRYLGARKDVAALLALSSILVLPSYYREGVPRILLEGGAMELPLVTTDMPGCRDVVRDGWNGKLVPPRNSRALAAAIVQLLRSPQERVEMGSRSLRHVLENFSLDVVADAQQEIYEDLLGLRKSPSDPSPTPAIV